MIVKGTYTAIVTPFDATGAVDFDQLRKNVEFQIEGGVDGLVVLGTTGETPTLSETEQEKIILESIKQANRRVVIMVGTGSNSTHHTVENTKRAKALGADAVLIVTPYYNKPTQEGIFRHFKTVNDAVEIPILVYNIAGRTGVNIETATLKRIAELKNVVGVKEASGNINQMGDVIREIGQKRENFSVMCGDDGLTLPLMALGGSGVVSVVSNLLPKEVSALVLTASKGDFENAKKMHYALLPIFKGAFIETNPIPIKEAMSMKGMGLGNCRLPLCEMSTENREKLRKILVEMKILP